MQRLLSGQHLNNLSALSFLKLFDPSLKGPCSRGCHDVVVISVAQCIRSTFTSIGSRACVPYITIRSMQVARFTAWQLARVKHNSVTDNLQVAVLKKPSQWRQKSIDLLVPSVTFAVEKDQET